ncbi:MAG TPA: hypothetical protein VFA51_11245 [Candidatus Udaeobacter sp.]|nr:hypothetical protein [Candidatus Udaeobacter sp.]
MSASDQDPLRSRVTAGMCYVAVGGVICTFALLQMRAGVSTTPGTGRSGPVPLEMVAGIAGIVVFMGLLQLLIALILKLRTRKSSDAFKASHLTDR